VPLPQSTLAKIYQAAAGEFRFQDEEFSSQKYFLKNKPKEFYSKI
jgi:hypothetical protein